MATPFWFNVDIQRVSDSQAEWPFLYLFNDDVQWLSGSQANGYFLFIAQLGHAEWPPFFYCSMLMPSQSCLFFVVFFCIAIR